MREWRKKRLTEYDHPVEIPEELQDAANLAINRLRVIASDLASADLQHQKTKANQAIEEAQNERDEALQEVQNLEHKITTLSTELTNRLESLQKLENQCQENNETLLALNGKIQFFESTLSDRENQLTEIKHRFETLQ